MNQLLSQALEERDTYRQTLAMVSAWRILSGTRDAELDRILESVGEDYEAAEVTARELDQRWQEQGNKSRLSPIRGGDSE